MIFNDWLNTIIDENELNREHVFEIDHEGTIHSLKFDVVVKSIIALPAEYQLKIKAKLVGIDSENGDLMYFLNYVAEGLVKYKVER